MRFVVFAFLVGLTLSACNPQDCQGAGLITPVPGANPVDNGAPANIGNPLCAGNNTTTNGDVNIANQTELNQLLNCKVVVGNVTIQNSTDIKDLTPLATLTNINQGYLLIFNNSALTDVELPQLQAASYGIGVIGNAALTAANFPAVRVALGDITILDNPELTQLGFPALEQIQNDARFAGKADNAGNLIVGNNPKFTGFSTFTKLDEIFGFFQVFGDDALQDFTGLEALQKIDNAGKNAQALAIGIDFDDDNNIIPAGNASLKDLTGFDILDTVTNGDIVIGFNPSLQDLSGLADLKTLDKNLFVIGNDSLVDLSGLEGDGGNDGVNDGLQVVKGSIFIGLFFDAFGEPRPGGNGNMQDLTGLDSLAELDGSLVLAFNDHMQNLKGLKVLPQIGKDFVIAGANMDDFSGADALTEIKGSFILGQFFGTDDQVLDKLFDAGPDGLFDTGDDVAHDPAVQVNLDVNNNGNTAMPALTTIDGDLIVAFSDPNNLRIADNLTTVGGRLILHDSDLADLTGFESVNSLGGLVVGYAIDKNGNFHASGNNNFSSFNGLNVTAVGGGGLAVGNNDSLNSFATLNVTNVAGSVTLGNENVQNLADVGLVNVGGNLSVGAIVNGNEPPVDDGFQNLTALQLDSLQTVGGDVLVAFNPQLTDSGFAVLNSVGGKFEITADNGLQAINGTNQLAQVGTLFIHDLPELDTLNLQGLGVVHGDLILINDPQLQNLNFNSLTTVQNNAELTFLQNLDSLDAFANLNTVGNLGAQTGSLNISDDPNIADTQGLNGLQTVGGDFLLARCGGINELTLDSLTAVGGSFEIAEDDGLDNLTHDVGGTATSLSLGSVGDALRIRGNAHLTSLAGLEGLASVGLALAIDQNPQLDTVLVDGGTRHAVDQNGDVGLVALTNVGNAQPPVQGIQGDRGVIDAQDNPQLDEAQLDKLIAGLTGFIGDEGCDAASIQSNGGAQCGLFFCGNKTQLNDNNIDPVFDAVACGSVDGAAAGGAGAGEGEGEGEGGQ